MGLTAHNKRRRAMELAQEKGIAIKDFDKKRVETIEEEIGLNFGGIDLLGNSEEKKEKNNSKKTKDEKDT